MLSITVVLTSVIALAISVMTPHAIGKVSAPTALRPDETPTPTPDEVLEQARREALLAEELKKKAVSDQERIDAEAAKLKSQIQPLGAPSVNVPTGNVQTDAAGWVESQMLAQEAAKQIVQTLTRNLCTGRLIAPDRAMNTLVVHNSNDLGGVELYNAVYGQLLKLKKNLEDENAKATGNLDKTDPETPTGPGPAAAGLALAAIPGVATSVIKSVAELVNLFRTDTSFTNKSVPISEDMVISYVLMRLNASPGDGRCANAIKIYYPALFPPMLMKSSKDSELIVIVNDVEQLKNQSVLLVERIDKRIEQLNKLLGQFEDREKKKKARGEKDQAQKEKQAQFNKCKPKKSPRCKKLGVENEALKAEVAALDEAIANLDAALAKVKKNPDLFKGWIEGLADQKVKMQALVNSVNLLSAKLNSPDENTKLTALAQLFRAEKLNQILSEDTAYTLRVAVTANGTTKIKKNLFVDAKVRHSAGANLVYQLFRNDGTLAQGAVMQCYIDYRSAKDVQRAVSGESSDMVRCRSAF